MKVIDKAQIKILAEIIKERFHPQKIILFGSCAYSNFKKSSDIDLLIIMDTKESYPKEAAKIRLYLDEKVGIDFPIDILVRNPQEVDKRIGQGDFFLTTIFKKGIFL
jgi:predicted nucleotidyltransferase